MYARFVNNTLTGTHSHAINIVSGATSLDAGDTLPAVAEAPYLDTAGRVEALYLAALTRKR